MGDSKAVTRITIGTAVMGRLRHVEEHLRQAERWWKGRLLVRRLAILAVVGSFAILLIGCMMYAGWFTSAMFPGLMFVAIGLAGLLASGVLLMITLEKRTDEALLASAIEEGNQPLLDRLNTLVHLRRQDDPRTKHLQPLIEQQAVDVLGRSPTHSPFPRNSVWKHLCVALLAILLTVGFYGVFQPWRFVGPAADEPSLAAAETDLELPPSPDEVEEDADDPLNEQPWTDVRISDPSRDLQVTRHEVVPLRIEAASNRALEKVEWFTSVNGGPEQRHALPPPEDSRYAAYDTELLLEDYNLQPWDVVSYFARATTVQGTTHDSDVYFIEVVPYQKEIEKLPGGEDGESWERLAEFSDMVERQQEVVRQTQQAVAQNKQATRGDATNNKLQARQFDSLAAEESQLDKDVQYLEASMRSQVDDDALKPLAPALEQAHAGLKSAEQDLRDRAGNNALQHERNALSSLVSLRKAFQQVVADNPDAFQPDALQQLADGDQPPSTEDFEDGGSLESESPEIRELIKNQQLEQQLRENARQYADIEQRPTSTAEDDVRKTTQETRRLADELRDLKDEVAKTAAKEPSDPFKSPTPNDNASPKAAPTPTNTDQTAKKPDSTSESPGQESSPKSLPDELNDKRLNQLTEKSDQVNETPDGEQRKELAEDVRRELDQLADALARDRNQKLDRMMAERQERDSEQMQDRQEAMSQARQFVQNALERQRNLQRSVPQRSSRPLDDQARRQLALQQSLNDYVKQNPEPFENAERECQNAGSAMRQSAQAMQRPSPTARQQASQAAEALQKLDDQLAQEQQRDQLADAARMQESLQEQIEKLEEIEQNPEAASQGQCQQAGGQAKASARQLQKMAQGAQPGSSLGEQLQQAMQQDTQQQIDSAGDQLAQSQSAGEKKQAAEGLREQLQPLADLLAQGLGRKPGKSGQGQSSQQARESAGRRAMERGMRQLESIARRQSMQRSTAESQRQLSQEALHNFSTGMKGMYGHNERTRSVMQQMRDQLEERTTPVDAATLQALIQDVQSLRREALQERPQRGRPGDLLGADPQNVPPQYRQWFRRYFEELSRQQ